MNAPYEYEGRQPQTAHQQSPPMAIGAHHTLTQQARETEATRSLNAMTIEFQQECDADDGSPDYFSTRLSTRKLRAF